MKMSQQRLHVAQPTSGQNNNNNNSKVYTIGGSLAVKSPYVDGSGGDGSGGGISSFSIASGMSSLCSSSSVSPIPTQLATIPIPHIAISPVDDSSESEIETEPAKVFHRRLSTKRHVGKSVTIKEGFLLKHAWSFQRWRSRYFRLKYNTLYYAKDAKSDVFDEIDLSDVCTAECSIKNVNHSFQVITPTRSLILCAETRREMEDWLSSLKTASVPPRSRGDSFYIEQQEIFSNHHHWYATSHARPTYCNVCRDALSGVTSHGLSCEVCKCKVHKRCAAKAIANCKWTTLATVGKDIIEDADGSIIMPHQWMEGNLPVSAICIICKKTCGSVLRLQDWRCLWCRTTVHVACRPQVVIRCPLGPAKLSVVPPTCVHSIGNDDSWDVISPRGNFSPLLVFVNSKSGDNQGVKFLRRFKQLLNPAQVFDLVSTGPSLGLRLFRHFEMFRILVCSGDGSVGWVLSEIDRYNMHKQCQVAVLPLGTGNDLARVLGWGSSCDDDAHLPQILERYETASTKMLDRWSIMVFEKAISLTTKVHKMSLSSEQEALLTGMVTSANENLRSIVETDDLHTLIHSTKTLCVLIDDLLERMCEHHKDDEQLTIKCDILRQKLSTLLDALYEEGNDIRTDNELIAVISNIVAQTELDHPVKSSSQSSLLSTNISIEKDEKDQLNLKERRNSRNLRSNERETLQSRANSVKRAIYNVVEHSEPGRPKRYQRRLSVTPFEALKIPTTTSSDSTPCTSPLPNIPPINIISPTLETTRFTCISPVLDTKRDSMDENFFNSINLPVPRQFADSRRSSGVPEAIEELEEGPNGETMSHVKRFSLTGGANISDQGFRLSPSIETSERNFLTVPIITSEAHLIDPLSDFRPIEVFERNYYMSQQMHSPTSNDSLHEVDEEKQNNDIKDIENENFTGHIPPTTSIVATQANNIYTSETLTIIDTDGNVNNSNIHDIDKHNCADITSIISNEECSITSEIYGRVENTPLCDLLQNLNSTAFTHIDSPETSDETDQMPGESIMDDISSVLGHDINIAMQDNTTTDDTLTLCSDTITTPIKSNAMHQKTSNIPVAPTTRRRNSSPPRHVTRFYGVDSDDNPQQFGFENIVFEIDNRCDDQKIRKPTRYCSLAQFVEGNDIARQSFKRPKKNVLVSEKNVTTTTTVSTTTSSTTITSQLEALFIPNISSIPKISVDNVLTTTTSPSMTRDQPSESELSTATTIQIHVLDPLPHPVLSTTSSTYSTNAITTTTSTSSCLKTIRTTGMSPKKLGVGQDVKRITFDESCKKESFDDVNPHNPQISVVVRPPTPLKGDAIRSLNTDFSSNLLTARVQTEIRRHSSHTTTSTVREYDKEKDRRYSGYNPNYLSLEQERSHFLNCSPAASRRISYGSLFKSNETLQPPIQSFKGSRGSLFGSTLFGFDHFGLGSIDRDKDDKDKTKYKQKSDTEENKKLPIINPLVKLPNWPNLTSGGSGFISKCLLANADTLCAAVSPLMDPDETLLAGYHEKCVMNNYFGIGIDAKISLDFHNKREEHPEKCRSRARNYMWYGVLGSKQLLQKTCKNLEQRVQLECDGQRIPLPSLQGIVILNIPSFMGGTNFWGNTRKDDIFLTPSFDDRILEVVAVFGSVQMAASRLINLQHHRIAQCQSVQINILGDEEIPIQVDGEAWLQPPGMIRILHKNRVQMLCRNRDLEASLKTWQEKQRQHSISIQREQSSIVNAEQAVSSDEYMSERECYVLLNFIEAVSSLVKWVKFFIISHPNVSQDLYIVACHAQDDLESIHPHGKLLEGPTLRTRLVEVIDSSRQLYDDTCNLLRDRTQNLILREDLETKLSAALANMEMELKKCSVQKCTDGKLRAYFNPLAPNEEGDGRRKSKAFWTRLRSGSMVGQQSGQVPLINTREAVSNWSVNEVVTWLETMQLSEYVDSFLKNDIRGKELLTLGRRDLKDLGVVKVGHVKRILQAIKDMNEC